MIFPMDMPKRVAVATDHAGFPLKEIIKKYLESKHIEVIDVGTHSEERVDYPPIIRAGCEVVLKEKIPGFIFGGTGNGEAMAANKMRGIRAAVCWSEESATFARSHNDANVCSMGGRLVDVDVAKRVVDIFLTTDFEGGRHVQRVNDLDTPLE